MITDKNGKELKVGQTVQYFDLSTTYVVEFIRDEMFGLRSNYRDLHVHRFSQSHKLEIVDTPAPAERTYTLSELREAHELLKEDRGGPVWAEQLIDHLNNSKS